MIMMWEAWIKGCFYGRHRSRVAAAVALGGQSGPRDGEHATHEFANLSRNTANLGLSVGSHPEVAQPSIRG